MCRFLLLLCVLVLVPLTVVSQQGFAECSNGVGPVRILLVAFDPTSDTTSTRESAPNAAALAAFGPIVDEYIRRSSGNLAWLEGPAFTLWNGGTPESCACPSCSGGTCPNSCTGAAADFRRQFDVSNPGVCPRFGSGVTCTSPTVPQYNMCVFASTVPHRACGDVQGFLSVPLEDLPGSSRHPDVTNGNAHYTFLHELGHAFGFNHISFVSTSFLSDPADPIGRSKGGMCCAQSYQRGVMMGNEADAPAFDAIHMTIGRLDNPAGSSPAGDFLFPTGWLRPGVGGRVVDGSQLARGTAVNLVGCDSPLTEQAATAGRPCAVYFDMLGGAGWRSAQESYVYVFAYEPYGLPWRHDVRLQSKALGAPYLSVYVHNVTGSRPAPPEVGAAPISFFSPTRLIDTTPGSRMAAPAGAADQDDDDGLLGPGRSFHLPALDLIVTVLSSGQQAPPFAIQVRFGSLTNQTVGDTSHPTCGNGFREPGEECEVGGVGCRTDCQCDAYRGFIPDEIVGLASRDCVPSCSARGMLIQQPNGFNSARPGTFTECIPGRVGCQADCTCAATHFAGTFFTYPDTGGCFERTGYDAATQCGDGIDDGSLEPCDPGLSSGCDPVRCVCEAPLWATQGFAGGGCRRLYTCGNGRLERFEQCDSGVGCDPITCQCQPFFRPWYPIARTDCMPFDIPVGTDLPAGVSGDSGSGGGGGVLGLPTVALVGAAVGATVVVGAAVAAVILVRRRRRSNGSSDVWSSDSSSGGGGGGALPAGYSAPASPRLMMNQSASSPRGPDNPMTMSTMSPRSTNMSSMSQDARIFGTQQW